MNRTVRVIIGIILTGVLVVAVISATAVFANGANVASANTKSDIAGAGKTATPTPTPTPTVTSTATTCPVEFRQETPSQDTAKVLADFTTRYEKEVLGSSEPYGTAVQTFLVNTAGKYALALVAWGHLRGVLLDTNSTARLVKDGCLSDEGRDVLNQLKGSLASAASFKEVPSAPADAINSGIYNSVYGIDANAGLRGDLRAIEITNADGSKSYILIRCGNPVYPAPPAGVPNVPTDNPAPEPEQPGKPKPSPKPTCEPPSTGTPPNCKGPATGDPNGTGNADDGNGGNDDPTKGDETINPVHPGADPIIIPPAPQPTTPASTGPTAVPTPDPAPEPSPEPSAPPSEAPDPPNSCVVIPGVEDCATT